MGKKYLETKKDSLESSVLGVWKTAIEEGDARMARMDGRTKEYREHRKKLESARVRRLNKEEVDLYEGKMKELHGYIQDGKSAKEIAKIMKLDVKTIKALMSGYKEEVEIDEVATGKGKFQVKTAKTKMGKITVLDFNNLDNAKKHLEDMKKKGHKGIISQDGKPVKEETILERIDRKLKERKNG